MCNDNNKQSLKNKIFTLSGCATGIDTDIPDAYGHDMNFYQDVMQQIKANVDQVIARYVISNQWCKSGVKNLRKNRF